VLYVLYSVCDVIIVYISFETVPALVDIILLLALECV